MIIDHLIHRVMDFFICFR